jgi:hypothetical protein
MPIMRLAVIPLGALLLLSACAPDPFLEAGRQRNQEISERVMRLAELRAICAGNPEMLGRALTAQEAAEQAMIVMRLKALAPDVWPQVPLFHPRVEQMRQVCVGDPARNIPGRAMTADEWNEVLAILYPPMEERQDRYYPTGTFQSYGYVTWEEDIWSRPAYRSDRYWEYERDRRYRDHERRYWDRDVRPVPDPPRYDQADRARELQRQRDQLEAQRRAEERAAAERATRNLGSSYSSPPSYSSSGDDARAAARRAEEAANEARRRSEDERNRQRQQEARDQEQRAQRQADEARRRAEDDSRRQAQQEAREREEQSRRQADEARRRAEDDSRRQAQQEAREREEQSRRQADEARRRAEDDNRRQAQQEAEQARRAAQQDQPLKDRSNQAPVRPD